MSLDLDALRTFAVIVEQGSFAAAAEGVRRTQPAITQRIQKLERSVGRPLFIKIGRSKRLTEDGLRLYEYAKRLLSLHDEACQAVNRAPVTGDIRLGAPDDVTDTILPNLLFRFSSLYPQVRIIIHIARSAFLMQALKQGDIDMTISTQDDASHRRTVVRTVPTVWISGANFRLDRSQPLPLVLHDEPSLFRTLALDALDRANIPYQLNFISPALSGIRAAVSAGLGVTARSVEMLNPQFRALAEHEGLPRMPDVSFYLYLGGLNSNPIARQLFDSVGH
jgi:DNA-binding transcriptional LysR family regulator